MSVELESLDDRALVARTQDGDRAAFAALVERYQERVLNVVYRRLDDRDLALDVAQEVFFKAYRGLNGFQGNAQFYTWLFRIALNESVSAHRKNARHRRPVSLDGPGPDGESMQDPPDSSFDPADAAARSDDQAMVQQAIAALEEDLARVILLRDIDGLAYQEIAEVLEVPLGSVKSRIHRARRALKAQLTQVLEQPE